MDEAAARQTLFELFNEIGIIDQLTNNAFNRCMPLGLSVAHFSVVNHLTRLGDGRTPVSLARAFQVTKPTMTSTLTRLESSRPRPHRSQSQGWAQQARIPDGGRTPVSSSTPWRH